MAKRQWDNVCTQVNTCALTGAAAFFAGIPDAAMVVNGPLWCYFYALRHLERASSTIGQRFFCSQADNDAVVYGTEEYLRDSLRLLKEKSRPAVVLIENSCSVSLIGDDIAGIVRDEGLPCPAVCIDSGGLGGGFQEGYRAAARAYFEAIPPAPRRIVQPGTVNLLGCTPVYYNAADDLAELKRMLALAGYKVLACPGTGSAVDELTQMNQAQLNIVVHEELGRELAEKLEREYGMPWLSLLPPYGLEASLTWLAAVQERIGGAPEAWRQVREEADGFERRIQEGLLDMQGIWGDPWFENTLIAAPASAALGLAQALRGEWADTGSLTLVLHGGGWSGTVPEGIDTMIDGAQNSQAMEPYVKKLSGGLLLGSGSEKALLRRLGASDVVFQAVAHPVHDELVLGERPFMGLRGALHMSSRLWNGYMGMCQKYPWY